MPCNNTLPLCRQAARTVVASLCLLLLSACSAPPPQVIIKPVPVLPPPGLMPECPEPVFTGTTYGEAVAFIPDLQGALRRCQIQIDTLEQWLLTQEGIAQ